jgi:hypothetical protein
MNFALFLCSLVVLVAACCATAPQIRYINSIPQFGSTAFSAALPHTTLFPSVAPSSVSSYSNLAVGNWNFFSTFSRKVSAGSDQYETEANNWYTVYTAQTTAQRLKNFLLQDQAPLTSGTHASVRTVNLLQFNFAINATATSGSHNAKWADVAYASATGYTSVPSGSYEVDWSSASLSKRSVEQSNCTSNCGGPFFFAVRRSYTIFVLPTTTIVVADGTTSTKRGIRSKRAIQKSNTLTERLSEKNEEVPEVEDVATNEEVANDSVEADQAE